MSYQLNTDLIPLLRDYAAAARYEESVKPIRTKTVKPIGKRKYTHMNIRKEDGVVRCRLYHTDCVTYYPDGVIHLNHGNYTTNTTTQFIGALLPFNVYQKDGYMMCDVRGGRYQIPGEGLSIKDGEVLNPVPFKVHKLVKPVIKELRGRYKELLQRAVALCNLADGVVPVVEGPRGLVNLPEVYDPADTTLVVQLMYMASSNDYSWQHKQHITRTSVPRIKRMLDHLLFIKHKAEVFEVIEVPLGEYAKDRYKKYFS